MLKNAQNLNKLLGYGTDEKNFDQDQYERQQRQIKQQTRIQKALKTKNPKRGP